MPKKRSSKAKSPELAALGRIIVYLRTAQRASQEDLAKTIGTSAGQVSKWEHGLVEIRHRSIEKIAAAYQLSAHELQELAQRVDRIVTWKLTGLAGNVEQLTPDLDPPALRALLAEVRLRRRDLEAESADLARLIQNAVFDERHLRMELSKRKE